MSAPKLLIAIENRRLAERLFHRLRPLGLEIKLAYDAAAAARCAHDWQPHFLTVDAEMTGIDGWQLAELLMLEPFTSHARTVLLVYPDPAEPPQNAELPDGRRILGIDASTGSPLEELVRQWLDEPLPQLEESELTEEAPGEPREPISLGAVLPLPSPHLGRIPAPAHSPRSIPRAAAPAPVGRSQPTRSIPRQQHGTQSPRPTRLLTARAATAESSLGVPHPIAVPHLVEAAFAAYGEERAQPGQHPPQHRPHNTARPRGFRR